MANLEPLGEPVTTPPSLLPSPSKILTNNNHGIALIPSKSSHILSLFQTIGGLENAYLYRYIPTGPFPDLTSFTTLINILINETEYFPYTIFSKSHSLPGSDPDSKSEDEIKYGRPIGMIAYLAIRPSSQSIEIGFVLFSSLLQRTTAATQTYYLLIKNAFEELKYSRVEWKANNFNEPSKRAATRLGFVHEGVFRKHLIVKGKRRDTWWSSIVDDEWEVVRAGLEGWLSEVNFDEGGRQKRKLEEVREEARVKAKGLPN